MTRRHTPQQQFKQAQQIAQDHGLFVVDKAGTYFVYRRTPIHNTFVGKRSTVSGLHTLVCKAANFH